jgi:hypothetical protein
MGPKWLALVLFQSITFISALSNHRFEVIRIPKVWVNHLHLSGMMVKAFIDSFIVQ